MKSDDIVLGILVDKPATGYEIKNQFSTIFSNFYNASFGSVYPILHKLDKEGKVSFEVVSQLGKPNKKVYSITTKGKKAFESYLQQPVESKKIKWDFMVRLFYSSQLDEQKRSALITSEINTRTDEIKELEALKLKLSRKQVDPYKLFCLDIGIQQKQLFIDKLKEFCKTVK